MTPARVFAGKGIFPTIKPFEWHEELSIHGNPSNPRPVLHYRQRTWSKHSNPKPMHEEQGWIRVLPMTHEETGGQRVEVVGAAQNGVSTIEVSLPHRGGTKRPLRADADQQSPLSWRCPRMWPCCPPR